MASKVDIRDREELIYLLSEAASFEHTVMCSYLYSMWSLKRPGEGLTAEEDELVAGWRKEFRMVVLEEMIHLTLVNNILSAIGASAQYRRPDFPVAKGEFPSDVVFDLRAASVDALQHFMYLERPEEIDIQDGAGFIHPEHFDRVVSTHLVTPTPHDYESQGQLYHEIGLGLEQMAEEMGEDELFCGHATAQIDGRHFGLPGLFIVEDVKSAQKAIEEIVEQGEGAPAHREDSHYARFKKIHDEWEAQLKKNPDFAPAWPATKNPWLHVGVPEEGHRLIDTEPARHVVDLGNSIYGLMLRTFVQVFSPHPLPQGQREDLAAVASGFMQALSLVGETANRLPLDADGKETAGLSFQIAHSFGALVQHSAATILRERCEELAGAAEELEKDALLGKLPAFSGVAKSLHQLSAELTRIEERYTDPNLPSDAPSAPSQTSQVSLPVVDEKPPALQADAEDINTASSEDITIHFDGERCIHSRHCVLGAPTVFLANVEGAWLHPETSTADKLAEIAHLCPSGAVTYERHDGKANEQPPEVNVVRVRENGPNAVHAAIDLEGHGKMFRATLCRCGHSKNKPFCDGAHNAAGFTATGEPQTEESDPLEARDGVLRIRPLPDGPNEVRGNLEVLSGTGRRVRQLRTVKLCRCGGSASKPYCDGTHSRIGFKSDQ